MCGIFGWQWKPSNRPPANKRFVLAGILGLLNENRGTDSWGWFVTGTRATTKGVGAIGPHIRFVALEDSVMCHTRHATAGAVTAENAHPFEIGNIILAHNGVVTNHDDLNKDREKAGLKRFEVDSMHIVDAIAEDKDLSDICGWGAIEWIDKREHETGDVNLCKLSASGDLAIWRCPNGIIWSSDEKHLEAAVRVAGLDVDKGSEFVKVPSGEVLYVRRGECFLGGRKLNIMGWRSFWVGGPDGRMHQSQSNTSGTYGSTGIVRNDWVDIEDDERQWNSQVNASKTIGKTLSKKERKKLIKQFNKEHGGNVFSYKDICKCGELLCDKHRRIKDNDECRCPSFRDHMRNEKCRHSWRSDDIEDATVLDPVPSGPKQIEVFTRGSTTLCRSCYNEVLPDGSCSKGCGKAVGGSVDAAKRSIVL